MKKIILLLIFFINLSAKENQAISLEQYTADEGKKDTAKWSCLCKSGIELSVKNKDFCDKICGL